MDTSIKVDDLLQSKNMDPKVAKSLARSITTADVDGDGKLTVEEILTVFANELSAKNKAARRMKWLIAVCLFSLLMLAANAGLTAAVVVLSKDTGVTNNVMVAKGSDTPVATARAITDVRLEGGLEAVLQQEAGLKEAGHVSLETGSGNHTFRVCGTSFNRERKTVILWTCSDIALAMTPDSPDFQLLKTDDVIAAGLASPGAANANPSGRRLQQTGVVVRSFGRPAWGGRAASK